MASSSSGGRGASSSSGDGSLNWPLRRPGWRLGQHNGFAGMGRIDQPGKLGLGLVDIDGSHGLGPGAFSMLVRIWTNHMPALGAAGLRLRPSSAHRAAAPGPTQQRLRQRAHGHGRERLRFANGRSGRWGLGVARGLGLTARRSGNRPIQLLQKGDHGLSGCDRLGGVSSIEQL